MNRLIHFMRDKLLLDGEINTVNIRKTLGRVDRFGRIIAKEKKLPLPELVSAVIHLKWAIEDNYDGSFHAQSDMLSILTQAFQYGLGLRIGEVLTLPVNALFEKDGEFYCNVWTEKGSMPMARYVPTIWRPVLKDAVERIQAISAPYRKLAKELEEKGRLSLIDERFNVYIKQKDIEADIILQRLSQLFKEKADIAYRYWTLKKPIDDKKRISILEVAEYLPFAPSANNPGDAFKTYKKWGLEVDKQPIGMCKHAYFVSGAQIKKFINRMVSLRKEYITQNELLGIIHDRNMKVKKTKDTLIKKHLQKINCGMAGTYTFGLYNAQKLSYDHLINGVVARKDAVKIIRQYVFGGYDHNKYIPILDIEKILPEIFGEKTASRFGEPFYQSLSITDKCQFYTKSSNGYSKVKGFLLEMESVHKAVLLRFQKTNYEIEAELLEEAKCADMGAGKTIDSKSFSINQKISEYLFLRAEGNGGTYNELLPQILSYESVKFSFKRKKSMPNGFERYGVEVDSHVTDSWQSHQGRHWQTNSLFRAGLASLVVNKWMGRTDSQGDHYDHQTVRERAARVGEVMLKDQERFLGQVPDKVRKWKENEISLSDQTEYLNRELKTVHYGPLGYCVRDLYLKPCEFNLKCLTGNNGMGCREYIYDLRDTMQREIIEAERDKACSELSRLFEVQEHGTVPEEALKMHIKHHMTIYRNTTSILERAEVILNEDQLEGMQDFQPFKMEGSLPFDCPYQRGGNE
jgi:hypothetical protein